MIGIITLPQGLARPSPLILAPNTSHPFWNARPKLLAVCHGPKQMRDLVLSQRGTAAGTPPAVRYPARAGSSIDCDGSINGYNTFTGRPSASPSQITMAAIVVFDSTASSQDFISTVNGGNAGYRFLYNLPATSIAFAKGGVADIVPTVDFIPTVGIPYFVAVAHNLALGTTNFVFRDLLTGRVSLRVAASNTSTPSAGATTWRVGGGFSSIPFNGAVALGAIAFSAMSVRAMVEWSADPWGVLDSSLPFAVGTEPAAAAGGTTIARLVNGGLLHGGTLTSGRLVRMAA